MDLSPGFILHNRYKILRLLGQGGMGSVYLANDQSLANEVAVKINRSESPKAAAQFIAEARLLATLRHPNLPRVIDYFQEEGMGQFLVMDYIAGQDLKSLLEHNEVPPVDQVLTWAVQLGAALSYLHRQNPPVFHRDVKPANLKLSAQNEIILVDFGIAKAAAASSDTSTGASLLSPGYAPPEQYGVGHTGAYSDQYAMGATFYQLLTGQLPADAFQRLMGKATLMPVQSINPAVPLHVDQALQRAMALRVEDRFASVDDFVYALTHAPANPSYASTTPAGLYPPTLASGFPPPAQPGYPPTLAYPTGQPQPPSYPPSQPRYPQGGQPQPPPYPQGSVPPPPYTQGSAQPPYPPAQGQPPNYPPSQPPYYGQPPAPKPFPWVWVGIIGFVVLAVVIGSIMALGGGGADVTASPTPLPSATLSPATATPAATATAPAKTVPPTVAVTNTVKAPTLVAPNPSNTPLPNATRTPVGTATVAPIGSKLVNPAGFTAKYFTFFQDRPNGFSGPDWTVKLSPGAKVTTKEGLLSVLGGVEAISDDSTFGSNVRVYLGGGTYGIGLKDFTLFVQRSSDGSSFLRMSCADQAKGAGQMLVCDWYQQVGGKETHLENAAGDVCTGTCDIEVELDNGTIRTYANGLQKISFKNTQFSSGAIGLRINNPTQTPYNLDKISVYEIPKSSNVGKTLLLDDLGEEWPLGHSDNEFATIDRKISAETYNWVVKSKQDVFTRVNPTPDFILPDRFALYADVQQLNGPATAAYGMLFRYQDTNNFYYFATSDAGTISVYAKQNGTWTTLIDAMKASAIVAGEVNGLAVRGEGNAYSFYVNDALITKITDDRFKNGTFGLAGELFAASQTAEWNFSLVQVNVLAQ